jgi:hypothetical protein
MKLFNIINKLTFVLCLAAGANVFAESVTPFSRTQETPALNNVNRINAVNAREVFRDSAPMAGVISAKAPSSLETMQRGPGIQLAISIPNLEQFALNAKMAKAKPLKDNGAKARPVMLDAQTEQKPAGQNALPRAPVQKSAPISSLTLPPAMWLLGSGLLGLVGISRRKRID